MLLLITAGGTMGYMIIEGWKFTDSFYMTIITISTVGFREVQDLTVYGKLFTAFLIISSFGTFAYAVTSITTYLVGGEYRQYFKEYKTMKEVKKMNNHVIICGFGRVGMQVAEDLSAHGNDFIIIEKDSDIVMHEKEHEKFLFLEGDGTNDDILKNAGIETASAVITCLPKDADNIYVVLAAREFKRDIIIVSRASYASAVSKLKMAGANNVIMPDSLGGSHMASLIANPDVMEFLDIIRVQGYHGANIDSISFEELPTSLQNKSIEELEAKKITGVTIIGYKDPAGEYHINPPTETIIGPKSRLFVLGSDKQIKKLVEHFHLSH
ncbi:MAG: potassium channel protein [Crocinitomicaceae bacterium]|nr:potassium channel protein [Crocinitomicaceae bacterium]